MILDCPGGQGGRAAAALLWFKGAEMAGRRGGKVVRWMGWSPDREVENGEILWWKDGEIKVLRY